MGFIFGLRPKSIRGWSLLLFVCTVIFTGTQAQFGRQMRLNNRLPGRYNHYRGRLSHSRPWSNSGQARMPQAFPWRPAFQPPPFQSQAFQPRPFPVMQPFGRPRQNQVMMPSLTMFGNSREFQDSEQEEFVEPVRKHKGSKQTSKISPPPPAPNKPSPEPPRSPSGSPPPQSPPSVPKTPPLSPQTPPKNLPQPVTQNKPPPPPHDAPPPPPTNPPAPPPTNPPPPPPTNPSPPPPTNPPPPPPSPPKTPPPSPPKNPEPSPPKTPPPSPPRNPPPQNLPPQIEAVPPPLEDPFSLLPEDLPPSSPINSLQSLQEDLPPSHANNDKASPIDLSTENPAPSPPRKPSPAPAVEAPPRPPQHQPQRPNLRPTPATPTPRPTFASQIDESDETEKPDTVYLTWFKSKSHHPLPPK